MGGRWGRKDDVLQLGEVEVGSCFSPPWMIMIAVMSVWKDGDGDEEEDDYNQKAC